MFRAWIEVLWGDRGGYPVEEPPQDIADLIQWQRQSGRTAAVQKPAESKCSLMVGMDRMDGDGSINTLSFTNLYVRPYDFYDPLWVSERVSITVSWTCAGAAAWHCDRRVSFLTWNLLGEAFNSWHFSLENVSYLSCLDEIQYLFSKGWSWWSCMRHRCSIYHAIPEYQS